MLVYQKTIFNRYYCIKSFCHLKTFGKRLRARLFICALWSPAGKGLTSWLSFVVSSVSLSLSHWYPGSGVVLDCIDSRSLQPYYFEKYSFLIQSTLFITTMFVPNYL